MTKIMTDNNALNIYILSNRLIEELDKLENTPAFKQKVKFHAKGLVKELEQFDKKVFQEGEAGPMMDYINRKSEELEAVLE